MYAVGISAAANINNCAAIISNNSLSLSRASALSLSLSHTHKRTQTPTHPPTQVGISAVANIKKCAAIICNTSMAVTQWKQQLMSTWTKVNLLPLELITSCLSN
jgi:hypothetical protein